jgi:hypothetical protein
MTPIAATPAFCQDNAVKQEANARLKAGLGYANQGKWEKARLSFLQAYAVLPSVDLLWNLAFAELKSGHPIDALQHFDAYEIEPKAEPVKVAALPKFRDRAYQQIGRIKVEAPAGALAWLDGAAQVYAEPIDVTPGDHRLKVQLGEQTEERRFSIAAGQAMVQAFSFVEQKPTSAALAETPASTSDGAVKTASLASASESAAITAAPDPVAAPLLGTPRALSPAPGWIAVGAGAGALALGIGYAIAASAKASDVEAARTGGPQFACNSEPALPACSELQDAVSKHDTYSSISTVSFVAAGILGVAGVGYLVLLSNSRAVAVAPYAGSRQSGLIFRAQF